MSSLQDKKPTEKLLSTDPNLETITLQYLAERAKSLMNKLENCPIDNVEKFLSRLQEIVRENDLTTKLGNMFLRVVSYTPGAGLLLGFYYWIQGKEEMVKATLIRQVNGVIACSAIVGASFLPITGPIALISASAAAGAIGSAFGTVAEALLAEKYITDPEVRDSLAKLRSSSILSSAIIGAFCGAAAGITPGFELGDVLGLVERCATSACATTNVRGGILFNDYLNLLAFILHTEVRVYEYQAKQGLKRLEQLPKKSPEQKKSVEKLRMIKKQLSKTVEEVNNLPWPKEMKGSDESGEDPKLSLTGLSA